MFDSFVPDGFLKYREAFDLAAQFLADAEGTERDSKKTERKLRSLLHSGKLLAWVVDSRGELRPVPQRLWAAEDSYFDLWFEGEIKFEIEERGNLLEVRGEVLIDRDSLRALLGLVGEDAAREQGPIVKEERRGRPLKFDWDAVWIEICARLFEQGAPETQGELMKEIQLWAQRSKMGAPEDSTLKPKIRRLFNRLKIDRE